LKPHEVILPSDLPRGPAALELGSPLPTVEVKLDNPEQSVAVFIVNKLSGPQFGEATLEFLYRHFNPIQVIDLLDEGIERMRYFKNIKNLKVIVGGGDGTMGGLIDPIYALVGKNITLIPMPLGTGNDLCRALGWGDGISTIKDVKSYMKGIMLKPLPTLIDRWSVKVTSKKNPDKVLLDVNVLLYFGIGLGGKFSYICNNIRKKYPAFFKSRVDKTDSRLSTSLRTAKLVLSTSWSRRK
jgi:diacylglycerol kinase (ATP)